MFSNVLKKLTLIHALFFRLYIGAQDGHSGDHVKSTIEKKGER